MFNLLCYFFFCISFHFLHFSLFIFSAIPIDLSFSPPPLQSCPHSLTFVHFPHLVYLFSSLISSSFFSFLYSLHSNNVILFIFIFSLISVFFFSYIIPDLLLLLTSFPSLIPLHTFFFSVIPYTCLSSSFLSFHSAYRPSSSNFCSFISSSFNSPSLFSFFAYVPSHFPGPSSTSSYFIYYFYLLDP